MMSDGAGSDAAGAMKGAPFLLMRTSCDGCRGVRRKCDGKIPCGRCVKKASACTRGARRKAGQRGSWERGAAGAQGTGADDAPPPSDASSDTATVCASPIEFAMPEMGHPGAPPAGMPFPFPAMAPFPAPGFPAFLLPGTPYALVDARTLAQLLAACSMLAQAHAPQQPSAGPTTDLPLVADAPSEEEIKAQAAELSMLGDELFAGI
ncbi:hypothetical protein DFJ74DRAFT_770032 [Hyaloraphidium curvatum]|nr:hypothetical protein DFJ74DRAFT_770032 [Hyaloraphidium curvatum]